MGTEKKDKENKNNQPQSNNRCEMLDKCEKEVIKRLIRKFGIVSVIVAACGFFGVPTGIYALINNRIQEATKEAADAAIESSSAAKSALSSAAYAKNEADKCVAQLEVLQDEIRKFQEEMQKLAVMKNEIGNSLSLFQNILTGGTESIKFRLEAKSNYIESRLNTLSEIVEELARRESSANLENYRNTVEQAKNANAISEQNFKENERYSVTIYYTKSTKPLSEDVMQKLRILGFKVAQQNIDEITLFVPDQSGVINKTELKYFDLSKLTTNIITYSENIEEKKATHVREILERNKVGCSLLRRESFINQYGLPYLALNYPELFNKNNMFEIYILF